MKCLSHARLGPCYTSKALADLGFSGSANDWTALAQRWAREGLRHAGKKRQIENDWPQRASAQRLVVWCAYELFDTHGLVSSNRGCVIHTSDVDEVCELPLLPVFVEHDRSKHAERQALLQILRKLKQDRRCLRDIRGQVFLYAVHTPCISCLAVFCQFRNLLPHVSLHVHFDDWSATRRALVELDMQAQCS